jgi:hypothetical protein
LSCCKSCTMIQCCKDFESLCFRIETFHV